MVVGSIDLDLRIHLQKSFRKQNLQVSRLQANHLPENETSSQRVCNLVHGKLSEKLIIRKPFKKKLFETDDLAA